MSNVTVEYDILREAVITKKQIKCLYKGHIRYVCPHTIGYKNSREKVLTFQFSGGSSSGLPPQGEWRCMFIEELSQIEILDGEWHTGANHSRPQTCVDDVDVEVKF